MKWDYTPNLITGEQMEVRKEEWNAVFEATCDSMYEDAMMNRIGPHELDRLSQVYNDLSLSMRDMGNEFLNTFYGPQSDFSFLMHRCMEYTKQDQAALNGALTMVSERLHEAVKYLF